MRLLCFSGNSSMNRVVNEWKESQSSEYLLYIFQRTPSAQTPRPLRHQQSSVSGRRSATERWNSGSRIRAWPPSPLWPWTRCSLQLQNVLATSQLWVGRKGSRWKPSPSHSTTRPAALLPRVSWRLILFFFFFSWSNSFKADTSLFFSFAVEIHFLSFCFCLNWFTLHWFRCINC